MAGADGKLEAQIGTALKAMRGADLRRSALGLLESLGYKSAKTVALDGSVDAFLKLVDPQRNLAGKEDVRLSQWKGAHFLFQLTNDEIPTLAAFTKDMFLSEQDYRASIIESFVFIALELENTPWTRGQLVAITREINRAFPMPAIVLFRIGDTLSLSVIDRRQHKRDTSKDVVSKRVSIIKDVSLTEPHRAHVDILADIALQNAKVRNKGAPTNFRDLYDAWIEKLSAQALNKRFYEQLAHWFFWASKLVTFPAAARETDKDKRQEQNQIATIRMLTRLIFVWFIKEKKLVPDALFEPEQLAALLNERPDQDRDSSTYYKAILQNLFFATLNTENADERNWRTSAAGKGYDGQYLVHTRYRYKDAFKNPNAALELFRKVPFLNGGLFECLDREVSDREIERNGGLSRQVVLEGKQKVVRIDGFSDKPQNPLDVPNKIFFAVNEAVDLNTEYATKGKKYTAQGLIELFSRYKFTVEENTPVEEEVALDPELLGKVFENLLASYNPDTKTTARKKSGSFYTPREVVDYMVDEALIAHFSRALDRTETKDPPRKPIAQALDLGPMPGELDLQRNETTSANKTGVDWRPRLEQLLDYAVKEGNPFTDKQTDALISSIDSLRALDPACGSGAYPMGLLQKLIHVLHRLDPDNSRWKQQNRWPYERRLAEAHGIVDSEERDKKIEEEKSALDKLDRDFSNANYADYARKLYLIEKCIYGVDIQPIAVQIAKLRFFISLIVSQKIDANAPNNNVTALPNLETKLVAANSLIPIDRPDQGNLLKHNSDIQAVERELQSMQARYFGARTHKTKKARRDSINLLRDKLAELLKSQFHFPVEEARIMAAWDQFDQNTHAPFFDPEWMFGLTTKFDITIGNPPYVRQERIDDLYKGFKDDLESHYKGNKDAPGCYSGTADLYVYFIQRSIELLNPGGAFAFITSNKWYRAKYGTNLRGWINRQAEIKTIIDFGDADVFDAIAYPTILVATRRAEARAAPAASEALRVMNWPQNLTREDVPEFPEHMESLHFTMPQKALAGDGWQLEPQVKRQLLERVRAAGKPLGDYVEGRFYRGILTGFNEAFVVPGRTKDLLIEEHSSSRKVLKPFLRGRDIKRWRVESEDQWLIKIESSENVTHPWTGLEDGEAEEVFAKTYPAIQRFMSDYRDDLVGRYDQGKYFWELRSCAYWEAFEEPKLVVPAISDLPNAARDLARHYTNNKATIFVTPNQSWVLATLNSPVSVWFAKQTFATKQGGFFDFEPRYSGTFIIPNGSASATSTVDVIVRSIELGADLRLEQLLNGVVYELFFKEDLHAKGLTLFAEAETAGLGRLQGLVGEGLVKAAQAFAASHLTPGARLHTMLQDLQTLDVVRIIEGKE